MRSYYVRSSDGAVTATTDKMSFKNKVVIVTGVSSGIGAVMALEFAKAQAKLTICARSVDSLNKIADKCATYHNHRPLVVGADLSKDADIEKVIKETVAKYKQIDVLVNNAACIIYGKSFENTTMEQFDASMNTNVRGVYLLTKLATPYLIASKGNVINISSIASTLVTVGLGVYSISKAAQDHLTRCIALELAPKGVRVNTVAPGGTVAQKADQIVSPQYDPESVPWLEGFNKEELNKTMPLGKMATSEDVAVVVLFLASDAAKSITGARYVVDNGTSLVKMEVPLME